MAAAENEIQIAPVFRDIFRTSRYKVSYGGRGGSRSWSFARALLIRGAEKPLRIFCAREVQRSIKDSVHSLLADQIKAMSLSQFYTVQNDRIDGRNGTRIIFGGLRTQDVHNIKSLESVDICWVEEAQTVSEKSWQILIPTIRKPGSEIWVTFNPGMITDPTWLRFVENPPPDTIIMPASYKDNPWFPKELEAERKHCKEFDPNNYENIWLGRPRETVDGAIYHREIVEAIQDGRIRPVPRDPLLPTHTVWDLGWNDQTSIIFVQRAGSEIRIIDYLEDSHRTLDDYVGEIEAKRWKWGTDFLPHDGAAKSLQTGLSPADIIRRLGREVHVIKSSPIESGIKQARLIFRQCFFDENKAARLVECLKRYRRNIPVTTEEPSSPVHDEYSHGADAFRMLSQVVDKMQNESYEKIEYDNRGIV